MKKPSTMENKVNSSTDPTTVTNISTATTSTSTISTKQSSSASTTATKQSLTTTEPMDMSINLKRRRDSEDSPTKEGEKKHPQKTVQTPPPYLNLRGTKQLKKTPVPNQRPAQLIPPPQKPKTTPVIPTEIPLPPSLSPITTPKILTRSHSATRLSPSPQTPSTSTASTIHKARARSASTEARRAINAFYFCEDTFENPRLDHLLKQTLKPLRSLKKIDEKDITNPYLFKDAPMLTTFVRSASNRTKELWHFIDEASRTDVMLADVKNTMLKKCFPFVRAGSRF